MLREAKTAPLGTGPSSDVRVLTRVTDALMLAPAAGIPADDPLRGPRRKITLHGIAAVNAAKTHCDSGHPFDEANTYRPPSGRRRDCRHCRADRHQRWRAGQIAGRGSGQSHDARTAPAGAPR